MGFFKDEDYQKPLIKMFEKLEPKVKEFVESIIDNHCLNILCVLDECESPIEQLLGVALDEHIKLIDFDTKPGCVLLPQSTIECFGKKYRADFLLLVGDFMYEPNECLKVVVECDGHDFHEKTKEQATKDKQRDRHLLAFGHHVIRFTGSEIWKDPNKCAREVIDTVRNLYKNQTER